MKDSLLLIPFCVAGIYTSYLTQGYTQEKLSTTLYEPDAARFPALVFLRLAESSICFFAAFTLLLCGLGGGLRSGAPPQSFIQLAISNTIGPACGIQALKNISYPAQVLAKSSKMVPVMVMGSLVYKKRYKPIEYFATLLIIGGVSIFALQKAGGKVAAPNAGLGYTLVLLNLILDGYTNSSQDALKQKYPSTSALQLMCWTNFWCSILSSLYMFGLRPEGIESLAFIRSHPRAALDMLAFCSCGACGQLFIFLTIATFGSLVNTTITTTRKFCSILLSVIWNGNALKPIQWFAVALVFGGITLKETSKVKSKPTKKQD